MCDHCGCRSFPPIAELTAEHVTILHLAWGLAQEVRAGRQPDATARRELLALLDRHVAKEETGLYPALLSTGAASVVEIDGLEADHRDLRRSLSDGPFDRLAYYALAAHIEDEEMELFPAAMLRFDDDEWTTTGDAHRAVDGAVPSTVP